MKKPGIVAELFRCGGVGVAVKKPPFCRPWRNGGRAEAEQGLFGGYFKLADNFRFFRQYRFCSRFEFVGVVVRNAVSGDA